MYHGAVPTSNFAAEFKQRYPHHFNKKWPSSPLSSPPPRVREFTPKTKKTKETTTLPPSPIDAETPTRGNASPNESRSTGYRASDESDDDSSFSISARIFNRTKPQEVPEGTTNFPTRPNTPVEKENTDPWLGWTQEATNARHHGISLEQLKTFCREQPHRERLWEAIENVPELRCLLSIWWKIIDHDGHTPTLNLNIWNDIHRLRNLTDDCNSLIALIATSKNITKATIIHKLGALANVTRDLEYSTNDNRRTIAEILEHRENVFRTIFFYIKDYNIDFWSGDIFYEAGCGPDPRDRDSWNITNGRWQKLGKEIQEEVLGLSPDPSN